MDTFEGGLRTSVEYQFFRVANLSREVDVGEWHSQDVRGVEQAVSWEVRNAGFEADIPQGMYELQSIVRPNLPWAERHFQERVSGEPLNPPPSHVDWPWASANEKHQTQEGEAFSHSYPERFWPKRANTSTLKEVPGPNSNVYYRERHGIRFSYGDLNDVVDLLARSPHTRQAYLPVWFPEDTGAVHRERVPCSLGYHFMLRDGKLHCGYVIRSCDVMRYFRDDVYFACRLTQWILGELVRRHVEGHRWTGWEGVVPGSLNFLAYSLHCFAGDLPKLRSEYGG